MPAPAVSSVTSQVVPTGNFSGLATGVPLPGTSVIYPLFVVLSGRVQV